MDVGGKSDPYMTFHLKGTDRKKDGVKSQVISNNCDPVWNQELFLNVADINKAELLVNMFDEDIAKDDKMMNEISYTLKDVPFNTVQVFDEDIKLKKKSAGHLHFEFELLGEEPVKTRDVVIEENLEYCNFSLGSYSSSYSTDFSSYNTCSHPLSSLHSSERKLHKHHFHASKPKAPKPKRVGESIKGVIVSCNGLPKADSDGTDAYVTITVISKAEKEKKSAEKVKTEIVHDTSDPVYNKEFNFEHAKKGDSLKVEVRQSHKLLGDQVIGQCIVPLKNVKENEAIQESYPLARPDKCPKFLALIVNFGTITLSLTHSVQYK
ncbi:hypothetical protein TRFO_33012 [Tritrichomonas foetus]|uniref:C2 domain-containing protein n=1 Tax=Tritrichomonas foetus TaxID=1144522 RepID=A0A1J4JPM5_9EUKA|nr:hypothetical protein TRFO_33012 [Tritrichomonas foetus]|eukprot:OHT00360.1 hypothetical protein TRFO_33012 [Tritrichomonas foetus]